MTPERWERITDVFRAALEKPVGERAAFVENECGSDAALRRDIERLLAGEAEPSLPSPLPEFLGGSATELAPGDMLAHYRVEAKSGEGGMGAVYRAYDTRLRRKVALKMLPPDALADPDRMGRLMQEARAASALNHPNIVTVYEVGSDRGVDFIAMEWVSGKTLAQLIGRNGLPLRDALKHAVRIASALAAAHRAGILHRDLKPANIMVNDAGQVKVLDFGLAKRTQRAAGEDAGSTHAMEPETDTGAVLGTVAYMSPEQAEGKKLDARSDIFSFGVVLYEMVTGKRAFERDSTAATLAAILKEEPKPPGELAGGLPPDLEKVLTRCLRKDPARRFQHMEDLEVALEELKEASVSGELVTAGPARPKRFRKLPWAVAGVLALTLAIALGELWRTRSVETTPQPLVRLDLDLGADVSLGSSVGPSVILSPDGTRLVFVSQATDGTCRLFARRLDQPKAARLSGTEGAYGPFFSPDGQWVGFFAGGKLKKTRVEGGEPISLCDAPAGRGASWGEDSNIIAALDTLTGLSQVPPEGGKAVSVTELRLEAGERTHRWPQVLPGGKAVLFNVSTTYVNYDEAGIAVVSLTDHRRKIVLEHAGMYPRYLPSGHLAYVTKGTLFAVPFDLDRWEVRGAATLLEEVSNNPNLGFGQLDFSRSGTLAYRTGGTEGLRTLQWLDGTGKIVSLGTEPASYNFPRLSPDGSRLVLTVNQGSSSDLWIYDWKRGSKTRLTNGFVNAYPVWSPDGRFVVFHSVGGMFWTRADGAGKPQPLTQSKNVQFPTSFHPDGTRLVFSELNPGAGADIRIVPVESGSGQLRAGEPQLFLKTPTVSPFAAFSPDGRWLAYADAEGGSYEVFVRAFPDKGTKVQISNAGGMMTIWSRNGHELFYRTEDQRIMVANYTVKGESFVADKPRLWSGRQLANLGLALNFDLMPDGKRFVVLMPAQSVEPREAESHVTLMVNFLDEVRRRVAAQGK